jgi:hypothetical protein
MDGVSAAGGTDADASDGDVREDNREGAGADAGASDAQASLGDFE